jgi:hypothetical protein
MDGPLLDSLVIWLSSPIPTIKLQCNRGPSSTLLASSSTCDLSTAPFTRSDEKSPVFPRTKRTLLTGSGPTKWCIVQLCSTDEPLIIVELLIIVQSSTIINFNQLGKMTTNSLPIFEISQDVAGFQGAIAAAKSRISKSNGKPSSSCKRNTRCLALSRNNIIMDYM